MPRTPWLGSAVSRIMPGGGCPVIRPGWMRLDVWIEGVGGAGFEGSVVGGEIGMVGVSRGVPAVFGVVDVDETPGAVFFAVDLGFDAVRGYL